jgi:hypothetical protein
MLSTSNMKKNKASGIAPARFAAHAHHSSTLGNAILQSHFTLQNRKFHNATDSCENLKYGASVYLFMATLAATLLSPAHAVDAVTLACGSFFTCVVDPGQVIHCWGSNSFGQLGINSTVNVGDTGPPYLAPGTDVGFPPAFLVSNAQAAHICAGSPPTNARCWYEITE